MGDLEGVPDFRGGSDCRWGGRNKRSRSGACRGDCVAAISG